MIVKFDVCMARTVMTDKVACPHGQDPKTEGGRERDVGTRKVSVWLV